MMRKLFGNVSDRERLPLVEGDYAGFITGFADD